MMRTDAAGLLARLGRTDFRYQEFSDAFADMELWPIFEAVLTDENVVGKPLSKLSAKAAGERVPKVRTELDRPLVSDRPPASDRHAVEVPDTPGIFQFYGTAPLDEPPESAGDLREFLSRLSAQNSGTAS